MKRFFAFAILISLLTLPAFSAAQSADAGLWYYDASYDISLRLPADWQVVDRHKGTLLSVVSPPESPNDPFRENCSLISSTLTTPLTVGLYADGFKADMRANLDEYTELEKGETTLAGQPALWWIYTHRFRFITAKVMDYVVVRDSTAFVFSCTAQPAKFDDYRPRFDAMAKSLTFGKVTAAAPANAAAKPASAK